MAGQNDDCYFFYNSTCAKGEDCPFRHEPLALGNEITCELWENGKCFRQRCKFRHSVIEKKRSQTACYYETQASGCLKPHCPFLHSKPRSVIPGPDNQTSGVLPQPGALERKAGMGQDNMTQMSIPVLGRGPVPHHHMHPVPFHTRGPPPPPPMGFNTRAPNPHLMQASGPMRYPPFGGVPQPMGGQHGYGHAPLRAPAHFGRGGLPPAMYPRGPYPMHMGREMESFRPAYRHDSSSSSEYSDYSSASGDEAGNRSPRESTRKRVDNARREGSQRVVKSSHRHRQPSDKLHRASEERKRSKTRSRDKSPDTGKKDRGRDKDRKKRSEREQEPADKESKEKRKNSGEEDTGAKQGEGDVDSTSPKINVKTLEEILREKALKKMEERRAERMAEKDSEGQSGTPAVSESTGQRSVPANGVEAEDGGEQEDQELQAATDGEEPNRGEPIESEEVESSTENREEVEKDSKTDLNARNETSSKSSFKIKTLEEILEEKKRRKAESQSNVEQQVESIVEPTTTKLIGKALKSIASPTKVPISAGKSPRKITVPRPNQADSTKEGEESKKGDAARGRRVIRVTKTTGQPSDAGAKSDSTVTQKRTRKFGQTGSAPTPEQDVCVKSFEEIMQEKRRRRPQAEKKSETLEGAAAPGNSTQPDEQQSGAPPGKSKSLPVIKSRKIKVVRRPATKSEGAREGSRPASPTPADPGLNIKENPAPEIVTATATTTVRAPPEMATTTTTAAAAARSSAATTTVTAPREIETNIAGALTAATTTLTAAVTAREAEAVVAEAVSVTAAEEATPKRPLTATTTTAAVLTAAPTLRAATKAAAAAAITTAEAATPERPLIATKNTKSAVPLDDSLLDDVLHNIPAKKTKTESPPGLQTVHAGSARDMTDKDLDDFFSEAIGNLSPAGSGAEYDDLHEDELMMELDAMLDQ